MTVIEELRIKLHGAQTDLEKLESHFQKFVELKDSIQSADTSLKSSSDSLASLAAAMEKGTQGLKDCVSSLQGAASLLAKFDPIEIAKKQDGIQQGLDSIKEKVEWIARGTEALPRQVHGAVQESVEATTARRNKMPAGLVAALVLIVASLGVSLYSLYLDHGASLLG